MRGFQFRYRLSGKQPTIKSFIVTNTETLSNGDMLSVGDGRVRLGATADTTLVGGRRTDQLYAFGATPSAARINAEFAELSYRLSGSAIVIGRQRPGLAPVRARVGR